ncbi:MAG TPA: amidohydrolase, partial [Anaerolineae bacterium]|nr:amidohydrolase [Anaerolineae bacterium]
MYADLILHNGKIYTMDPARPWAQAIAIAGGKFVAVGDETAVEGWKGSRTTVLDLEGRTAIPGLTDSHVHFASYALSRQQVALDGITSLEEALQKVAERVCQTPDDEWVVGRGWDRNLWPGATFPDRTALDRVAPHHPVALRSKDGHTLWVNSLALAQAGITASTADPPGGEIARDPQTGEPTGILKEHAIALVTDLLPPTSPARLEAALQEAIAEVHRLGLTGIHDCEGREAFWAFQHLAQEGKLGLRVCMMLPVKNLDAAVALGLQTGFGNAWIRIGSVKMFADGALGSRTAAMLAPYEDQPDNVGIVVTPLEEMRELVRRASEAGLSTAIHAIGDRANRMVLDVLAERRRAGDRLRHRIEHAQLLAPADIPRLARLGVIASMQPIHATADMDMVERHWGQRGKGAYAFRTLLDEGTHLAFGSDAPVETIDPLRGIHAAVTRQRADGTPPDGWYPQQRLSVAKAVHAYTLGAAYASGEEQEKGSITSGKWADLIVLSRDIFTIEPAGILETKVVSTIVNG